MTDFTLLYSKTKKLKVLIAEDYSPARKDLFEALQDLFKSVKAVEDGEEALRIYKECMTDENKKIDILITDIKMPKLDGVELCKAVKKLNSKQEIIVLSAYSDSEYLVKLINLGISRFINKPMNDKELIETLLKISSNIVDEVDDTDNADFINIGNGYSWNRKKHLLFQGETLVELTYYECLMFDLLIQRNGYVCTKETIIGFFDANGLMLSDGSIRNFISKLRMKLSADLIESVYGVGYRLNY